MTGPRTGWLDVVKSNQIYRQPYVYDTPHQQNANNVLGAVHHFSHKLRVRRFDGLVYDHGRHNEGPELEFFIYCELQFTLPANAEIMQSNMEHRHSEGDGLIYYHPHYQKNLDMNDGNPIYLRTADSRFVTQGGTAVDGADAGAADIVVVEEDSGAKRYYEVFKDIPLPSSSNEEEHGVWGGYRVAGIRLHRDHHQARKSDTETIGAEGGFIDQGEYVGKL